MDGFRNFKVSGMDLRLSFMHSLFVLDADSSVLYFSISLSVDSSMLLLEGNGLEPVRRGNVGMRL